MASELEMKAHFEKGQLRRDALKQIWRETHRDYKGKFADGTKTVLILRQGGTCLVPLDSLTDQEIASRVKGYVA